MLDQKIKGLYGITPNKNLNINLIKNVIIEHKVNILQYRLKTQNKEKKLDEYKKIIYQKLSLFNKFSFLFLYFFSISSKMQIL